MLAAVLHSSEERMCPKSSYVGKRYDVVKLARTPKMSPRRWVAPVAGCVSGDAS